MVAPSADWNLVPVRDKLISLDGTPASGTVIFAAVGATVFVSHSTLTTILGRPVKVTLDKDGSYEVLLPATDDPDIEPHDFTYMVTEQLNGGGGRAPYNINVPLAAAADGINITDVIQVEPATNLPLNVEKGDSAYVVAVDNGFVGTVDEWLTSLHGHDAYTIATEQGFVGTRDEWLTSLIGPQGPANTLTVGSVTTGAPGTPAEFTISGQSPNQVIDVVIPEGLKGDPNTLTVGSVTDGPDADATITGEAPNQTLDLVLPRGPANVLTIGSVTTGAPGSQATATITGTAPNQVLDLVIPEGLQGIQGDPNTLTIGTVTDGPAPDATITGQSPNQVLDLVLQRGPENVLTVGTITTGAPGTPATATITGESPNQVLNLTIPEGLKGDQGDPNTLTVGSVTSGAAPEVTISGTSPNQTIDFVLEAGPGNELTIGTVTTADTGTPAAATISGTSPSQVLDLVLPRGLTGKNARWLGGDGAPAADLGIIGDWYLDLTPNSGDVYEHTDTGWVLQANIMGPEGPAGPGNLSSVNGDTGPDVVLDYADVGAEPAIAAGTAVQFWRGDKTWQQITKVTVGLDQVDNTSDADKPVSTAQQAALDGKSNVGHTHTSGDVTDLGTAATRDVPASGDAAAAEVVVGTDSRLSDARPPTAHNHDGRYYTESETDTKLSGKSDVGHTHTSSDVTDLGTAATKDVPASGDAAAGEVVTGADSRLTDARPPTAHNHDGRYYTESEMDTKLGDKAPLDSPPLTGAATLDGQAIVKTDDPRLANTDNIPRITRQGNVATGSEFYELATLPIDNAGNYSSLILSGRAGGWINANQAYWQLILTNRSDYSGDNVGAAVFGLGAVDAAKGTTDIVVYKQADLSAIVYLKVTSYYAFDLSYETFQTTPTYSGTAVTPTGTEIWSMAAAPMVTVDQSGVAESGGQALVTTDDPRLSDARPPTPHTHDDRYYTESEVDTKLAGKSDTGHIHTTADVSGLGTAATKNVPASGNAAAGEVVTGADSRLSDARTPKPHTHDDRYFTESEVTSRLAVKLERVVWSGSAYPARPAGVDHVEYVGPQQPTDALANDTWVKTPA